MSRPNVQRIGRVRMLALISALLTGCEQSAKPITQGELDAAIKQCPALEIALMADSKAFAAYTTDRLEKVVSACVRKMEAEKAMLNGKSANK
jgi:hypothetical protein